MKLEYYLSLTQVLKHNINQDSICIVIPYNKKLGIEGQFKTNEYPILVAIADGIGSGTGGEIASDFVVTNSQKLFQEETIKKYNTQKLLKFIILDANNSILEFAIEHKIGFLGTKARLAIIQDSVMTVAWVGDSRAYLFRESKLTLLSNDHTNLWKRYFRGEISSEYVWENRHLATMYNSLGYALCTGELDIYSLQLLPNDKILITTYGLTSEVQDVEIERILSLDLQRNEIHQLLYNKAIENGSKNGVTIFIGEIGKKK